MRVLSNPLANVFQKSLTGKGAHPVMVNFLTYLGLGLICIFWALDVPWGELEPEFWIYSVLGGVSGALGNAFLVKALQTGELSVLGPINSYKSVIGLVMGIFLLGELPNVWGLAGIGLIIYGSYFILDTADEKFSLQLFRRKEIRYRLLALLLTAIEAVFDKKIILASSVGVAFISWCWFGGMFAFLLLFFYRLRLDRKVALHISADWKLYASLLACMGLMQLTTNYVFAHMPVGYALSLFQLSIVVSVWLGFTVFREKDIGRKIIGSLIMMAGSVLIILLKDN